MAVAVAMVALAWASPAAAQGLEAENRPMARVEIVGLRQVPEQLVRNVIRSEAGDPFHRETVEQDIIRLNNLGRFGTVKALVDPLPDGSVVLSFEVQELSLLADVQVVGNKTITDQELLGRILLRSGDPIDPFLIERGKNQIREAYAAKGFFVAEATVNEELLEETGILVYRVREGPKVRLRDFRFEGNEAVHTKQLRSQVRSRRYIPIFSEGALNEANILLDVARIREYYRSLGYLDALVGRRIDLSPNQQDAVVTFLIEEGRRYTVDILRIEGNEKIPSDQFLLVMPLKSGNVFSQRLVDQSVQAIEDMYGKMGYMETLVEIQRLFHEDEAKVDVVVLIEEGRANLVGRVSIRGNETTQERVVLHQVRGMTPGRPFDRTKVDMTRQRLNSSPLFNESTITLMGDPDDEIRDVLIEVKERNTGSLAFGAALSSDAGVVGAIDVTQRNFDITDFPDDFSELVTGRAFRGAGQFFQLTIQPGNQVSTYSINFREPHFLDSDFSFDVDLFYFQRDQFDWQERRIGGGFGFGRRFGDVWSGFLRVNAQQVNISGIDNSAPTAVFDAEGDKMLFSAGVGVMRSTVDDNVFPTRGSRLEMGINQFFGDYNFFKASMNYRKFWTLDTDYMGRKSVLSYRFETGYIFQEPKDVPFYERFYAGGHRTFRGFAFRGVGPRGIKANSGRRGSDPVGGNFILLTGLQYDVPVYEEFVRWVFFTDMGTVQEDFGLDKWRVSVGTGIRLKIPFLGQIPFALDVAYPILKESGDQIQYVSFDLSIPF